MAQQQPVQAPADEIAALRARIAELEGGNAHGNHPPARVPTPHQAMVADPTAVDRIRANLAGAKEEPKRPSLPALRPGHKVSALSLREFYFECIALLLYFVDIPISSHLHSLCQFVTRGLFFRVVTVPSHHLKEGSCCRVSVLLYGHRIRCNSG
jgi:hypothetical protein